MASPKNKLQADRLSDYVGQLWLNDNNSDVIFFVEGEKLPAHRLILASREYFRALLLGNYVESSEKVIELINIRAAPFKAILKYIYHDFIILDEISFEENIEILFLAHLYDFDELTAAIEQRLIQMVSLNTVGSALEVSQVLSLHMLMAKCLTFLDQNAKIFLQHNSFTALTPDSVHFLLKRNTFAAPEILIFEALQNWLLKNGIGKTDTTMFKLIRFPLMSIEDLVNVVQPSGVLQDDIIFNTIREKLHYDMNSGLSNTLFDDLAFDARVFVGGKEIDRNNGGTFSYDPHKTEFGIILETAQLCSINHIQLLLDASSYNYYVEVSANQIEWVRVADNTQFLCRSHQYIYFRSQTVRFIRLIGTLDKIFRVESLKAFHIDEKINKWNGFVQPSSNIATYDRGAIVTEGKNGAGLLFGTYIVNSADCDRNEFTSHSIDKDENILIQFGQPYYVESLRLTLWNEYTVRFNIHTSTDQVNWEMAVDMSNTNVSSSSSPVYKFNKRLVLFVRIVGTYCSFIKGGEEFRCVRFECPGNSAVQTIERKLPIDATKKLKIKFPFLDFLIIFFFIWLILEKLQLW